MIRVRLLKVLIIFLFLFYLVPHSAFALVSSELLTQPWRLSAKKGAQERYQLVDPNALKSKTMLRLLYNLHGACLLDGDASAIIFDQPFGRTWRYISLARYGRNCMDGEQSVDIPLGHFRGLDITKPVGTFHIRIWQSKPYTVELKSAVVYNPATDIPSSVIVDQISLSPTPTQLPSATPKPSIPATIPIPTPTQPLSPSLTETPPTPPNQASWSIQSVSSMKETKDRVCSPRNIDFIKKWVDEAVTLGVNYIAIETPYENPGCGDAARYTADWVAEIRARGLNVWHRHMPLAFEGIYSVNKNTSVDYLKVIADYIKTNRNFFAEGDIFTPIPEPQNGGIAGVTYCAQGICQFSSAAAFNAWLRSAMNVSEAAFAEIGLGGKMKIGYFGFDGFVTWGDNNPDWKGILEDATVLAMGNLTIDHYPEIVGDTMNNDLNELEARYPNIPIIIGEWGTITGGNTEAQVVASMTAARRPSVVGFNYWHMGMGGNEALVTEQFVHNAQFDEVQRFYKNGGSL